MTPRSIPHPSLDRQRVQRSALAVGLWVGGASAAIIAAITIVSVLTVSATSRADRRPGHNGDGWSERIINVSQVAGISLVLGLVGIVALALIAWWSARRAALPLATALQAQRDFVADASHELRTPLTTLTSRIQVAQHRIERGGDVAGALAALRADAAVMDAVLTDLLVAAETAGTGAPPATASATVEESARSAVQTIELRADSAAVAVIRDIAPGVTVRADAASLTRALTALLDNAVRHSPAGGTVTVSARESGRRVEIRVADEGAGIAGIDPARVFDRFASTTQEGPARGFGLGLALVHDIATRFGGTIAVESSSAAGTVFVLTLPAGRGS